VILMCLLAGCFMAGCGSLQQAAAPDDSPSSDSPRSQLESYVKAVQPAVRVWAESVNTERVTVVQGVAGRLPRSEIRSMLRISESRRTAARRLARVQPPDALAKAHRDLVRGLRLSSEEWALNARAAQEGVPFANWYSVRHADRYERPFARAAERWDLALSTLSTALHVPVPFEVPDVMRSGGQ